MWKVYNSFMLIDELKKRGILQEQIHSYYFDSLQYEEIDTAGKLYNEIKAKLYKGGKTYLFLDEVQEVKDWEKAVSEKRELYHGSGNGLQLS